ncbi:MAG: tRNA (adenosine(37)-N6)-dimethylallyltransferase MiaA [Flavobacterium sp.]
MSTNHKYLITVIGPTAIGKTAMAIAIAQHFGCEIISADSRQFFSEMKIGTAVPSDKERDAASHYFIQNKSIFENYTVGDFEREALAKLDELFRKNNVAVMVGGSGLYIDAVLKGFDDFPDIDSKVREDIIAKYEAEGVTYLQNELRRLDPVHYANVAKENPQRMMRALEVSIGTGLPYSSFLGKKQRSRKFTPVIIGLEAERAVIYNRINRRVDIMVDDGLIEEARELHSHKNLNALQTVGYRELFDYFDKQITLPEAIEQIKMNTRRFAKRQMTWFKRTEGAKWFDYTALPKEVIDYIETKL